MPWFKVDDTLHGHPKTRKAGLAAMGLWTLAGSYSASYLTEGFIPEWWVAQFPQGKRRAAELVAAKFWRVATRDGEPGWIFHDWSKFQPSKPDVEADRAAARERQKKWRETRRETASNAVTNGVTNAVTNATSSNGVTNASPSLPLPSLPLPSIEPAPAGFDDWWAIYPRKVGKGAAIKAFKAALRKVDIGTLISDLRAQLPGLAADLNERGDFRPHPATWLNEERWQDEIRLLTPIRTRSAATPEGW